MRLNLLGMPAFARASARQFGTKRMFHASMLRRMEDPYKILGVDKTASAKDIKKKYYQLAKKYHPDVNKEDGADKKFQQIQDSYELLSDETKRAQYDQFGSAAFGGAGGPGGPGNASGPFNPFGNAGGFGFGGQGGSINLDDLFSAFTGGAGGGFRGFGGAESARARPGPQLYKGDDIEIVQSITLEDASTGTTKNVKYSVVDECGTCHGSGLKAGKTSETCSACNGSGSTVHLMQGGFQMASTCHTCGGSGVVIPRSSQCSSCHGEGVVQEMKTYNLDIPAGVADGMRLRVGGEGDSPVVRKSADVRTQRGDLYVRVHVKENPNFIRNKSELIYSAEIPMTTAVLGGKVPIPTLGGARININISPGTQHGDHITIPDQGMPMLNRPNVKGDMRVNLKVRIPRAQDATQTMLFEALADSLGDKQAKRIYPPISEVREDEHDQSQPGLLKRLFNKLTNHHDKK